MVHAASVTSTTPATLLATSVRRTTASDTFGTSSADASPLPVDGDESHDGPIRYRHMDDIMKDTRRVELEKKFAEEEAMLIVTEEPSCYREAAGLPEWENSMDKEIEAIKKNSTWSLVKLPAGHKAIGLKWVLKLKKNSEGEIIKNKARLVAKGYVQQQGIDFDEVFAPVTRLDTVRVMLAIAANRGWQVHHLDVKSAFLNGELQEEVYVTQPEGYEVKGKEFLVYKLYKALYGLRQAPRAWNMRLDKSLKELGFTRCTQEQAVYIRGKNCSGVIVGVYVDDLIVTGKDPAAIVEFKQQMLDEFDMSDLGLLHYYLGIEVTQGNGKISIKQSTYAKKVLEQFGMMECNPTKYPMEPKAHLQKDGAGHPVDVTEYRRVIGCLRYLLNTRPDLSFAVGVASRFMERPNVMHHKAVKQILRYVKGTIHLGLVYGRGGGTEEITGFTDSDMAGDMDDRKSTSDMTFYVNECLVAWNSQKQKTVALSSCEAEFMAATSAACHALWLRSLLAELLGAEPKAVKMFVDNKSAIALMKNPVFHGRRKHIDTRFHFIRECVEGGQIIVEFARTEEQRADLLTKALSAAKQGIMRHLLGMRYLGPLQD